MKQWVIPTASAKFVAKMEDVLDVYHRPYDIRYPVVCIDETSKALRLDVRAGWPTALGQLAKQDYEYERNGQVNLYLATEPLRGWRKVSVTASRTNADFAAQLRQLVDEDYPDAVKVILICDNLNTHQPHVLYEVYTPAEAKRIADKLEFHYTPEHGSWLDVAEIELSALSRQCLARRIGDADTLAVEVAAWTKARNASQRGVDWQFSTADARIKLKRLYPAIIT